MKIEAGKYYRMRGDGENLGQVVGPMYPVAHGVYAWGCASFFFTETGLYDVDSESEYDLIAEVYVSDTPPADGANTFRNCTVGTYAPDCTVGTYAPEAKTLRDEFAMAALTGFCSQQVRLEPNVFAKFSYDCADAMMEARKK